MTLLSVLLLHFPAAFLLRGWRVLAQPVNGRWIMRYWNRSRLVVFQKTLAASELPRLIVIVMPSTLHFLLPCLALLQGRAQIVLLGNGARRWECRLLRERFPTLPLFKLWTLPLVSVAHGEVISLLLDSHPGDFGIVDHDCYLFDERFFAQLQPADDEALLALFSEASQSVAMTFPLTYFLFFHAAPLRDVMRRYGIDARIYRETPATAREALLSHGLGRGSHLKSYHSFHDTLHILLLVALAEGLRVRYLSSNDELPAMHVGGTSIGSHHTKDLYALYIHLRFLELLDDPLLWKRYAFLTAPLRSSAEALARRDPTDPAWQGLATTEALIQCLRETLPDPAGQACASAKGAVQASPSR